VHQKLTTIIAILAITTIAHAGVYEHEVPFSGAVPGSQTVQLPKYDGSETLVSVVLFLDATAYAGSITWDNESDVLGDVLLGIGAEVTATAPDATMLVATPMTTGSQTGIGVDDELGAPDFTGTDTFTLNGGTSHDTDTKAASNFTPYMGAGMFDVDVDSTIATSHMAFGGAGNTQSTGGTTSGKIKVVYTTIPEPATISLLTIGGVAALIRRRK
jgi:hypothetical protein